MSYRDALDSGLYPSIRMLSEDVEVSITSASLAVKLARLPANVLKVFPSLLDLQYRWASPLGDAVDHHQSELESRIQAINAQVEEGAVLNSAEVFEALTKPFNVPAKQKTPPDDITVAGKSVGSIKFSGGRLVLEVAKGVIPSNRAKELSDKISQGIARILGEEKLG
jgi:ParB family chromosome partitioning protein